MKNKAHVYRPHHIWRVCLNFFFIVFVEFKIRGIIYFYWLGQFATGPLCKPGESWASHPGTAVRGPLQLVHACLCESLSSLCALGGARQQRWCTAEDD